MGQHQTHQGREGRRKEPHVHQAHTTDAGRHARLYDPVARADFSSVHVSEGGSANPDSNLRLAQVIEQARRHSMPVATIQNVLKISQKRKEDCKPALLEIRYSYSQIVIATMHRTPNRPVLDVEKTSFGRQKRKMT